MTRRLFLYLSKNATLRRWMESSPAAQRLTRRFVAGETLAQGIEACASIAQKGFLSTLDHLGENVSSAGQASASAFAYLQALDQIAARNLPSTVSIKLTQFGLDLGEGICRENVRKLCARAREIGSGVEIDMESSEYTDRTLAIAEAMHHEFGGVRAVIQAYLYRSAKDIERLCEIGQPVRLCKGAYNESADVAWPAKVDVDRNYVELMKTLLQRGVYPAIATHDQGIINETTGHARRIGIDARQFEFQMLYGIRRDLQNRLIASGYSVRLYVPYGAEWYPYFMRRLAERPANAWFLIRGTLRG